MKIFTGFLLILLFGLFTPGKTVAQSMQKHKEGGLPDPQLSQKDNDYLDRQASVFLDSVKTILAVYPPVIHEGRERGFAKLLMDAVFHEKFAAFRKPGIDFFHTQADHLIKELVKTKADQGAIIWKLYNMGFIVRTKSVTLAFDLVGGASSDSPDFALPAETMEQIVSQCDVLFISHKHHDHADKAMAEKFLEQGKPVIAPEEVWKDDPIFAKITHLERTAEKSQKLKLANNRTLDLIIYPGHQLTSAINNVSMVTTPEGITVAHTGDQINEGDMMGDFDWIDRVAKNHKVDILMPNAWTTDIFRIVRGFNPALVVPGHELELGHTVWDRLPYWGDDKYLELNYACLKKSKYPVVVMVWGECYHYNP